MQIKKELCNCLENVLQCYKKAFQSDRDDFSPMVEYNVFGQEPWLIVLICSIIERILFVCVRRHQTKYHTLFFNFRFHNE